jgi:tRNA pseudouridine55 synthase
MNLDGLILIRKSEGCTSHDIVQSVRRLLRHKKVGHFGTLDPMATGLMLIALGKATRLFPFFSKLDKEYTGRITLGLATDTYDATGTPTTPECDVFPDEDKLCAGLQKFQGRLTQIPPLFSAKKYKGQPLYKLARANKPVSLSPSEVTVYSFQLLGYSPPHIDFFIKCSTGTYIRSLAHDLGLDLGCHAYLSRLERTRVGDFDLQDAHSLEEIEAQVLTDSISKLVFPIEDLLPQFPKLILKDSAVAVARNGSPLFPEHVLKLVPAEKTAISSNDEDPGIYRVFDPTGKLLAFARREHQGSGLHPFLVIDTSVSIS